jgi:hypothetical protein
MRIKTRTIKSRLLNKLLTLNTLAKAENSGSTTELFTQD